MTQSTTRLVRRKGIIKMEDSKSQITQSCAKHCEHGLRFMTGDPIYITEHQVWCTYEDEDGFCGHVCREANHAE